jgi:hypothetical protein
MPIPTNLCRYIYIIPNPSHRKEGLARGYLVEGSLEVKLPTIWTVEKQR